MKSSKSRFPTSAIRYNFLKKTGELLFSCFLSLHSSNDSRFFNQHCFPVIRNGMNLAVLIKIVTLFHRKRSNLATVLRFVTNNLRLFCVCNNCIISVPTKTDARTFRTVYKIQFRPFLLLRVKQPRRFFPRSQNNRGAQYCCIAAAFYRIRSLFSEMISPVSRFTKTLVF